MKKYILGIIILLILVSIYFNLKNKQSFFEYELEGKTYKLLTANNLLEWQKGLMFFKEKKELKGADGMIFIFPNKEIRTFWNKNTYLALDVYWLNDDKIIGKDYLPSILETKELFIISSKKEVNKVVEIVRE